MDPEFVLNIATLCVVCISLVLASVKFFKCFGSECATRSRPGSMSEDIVAPRERSNNRSAVDV